MTAKTNFLARLQDEINAKEKELKTLKEVFASNSQLSEDFFTNFFPLSAKDNVDTHRGPIKQEIPFIQEGIDSTIGVGSELMKLAQKIQAKGDHYGQNRRTILQILKNQGKAMLKQEILEKFEEVTGKKDQQNTVTNALAGLSFDKIVIGYKPTGAKFRGNYWALITWFEGGKIKKEYEPGEYDYLKNILR